MREYAERQLIDLLAKLLTPTRYIVDIGANTGPGSDPVYSFLKSGEYSGLCVEPVSEFMEQLNEAYPSPNVAKLNTFATPENIITLLADNNVPKNMDIFKIDIDGYDLSILRKLLEDESYKPSILVAEINEKIPVPVYFEVKYDRTWRWDESHYYGFSLQAGYKLLKQHDYVILGIYDLNNIIAVRKDLYPEYTQESMEAIYKRDFIDNPSRHDFYWNRNVENWVEAACEKEYEYLLHKINEYFMTKARSDRVVSKTEFELYIDEDAQ